jgi:hypothetical protein
MSGGGPLFGMNNVAIFKLYYMLQNLRNIKNILKAECFKNRTCLLHVNLGCDMGPWKELEQWYPNQLPRTELVSGKLNVVLLNDMGMLQN